MTVKKAFVFIMLVCLFTMGSSTYSINSAFATEDTPPTASVEESVCQLANTLLGAAYKAGGNTPSGFDTSGFVQYVYKAAAKLDLPRITVDQHKKGIGINPSDLIIADLVFFKINGKVQSVGIYLGNNKFVTVTTKKGVAIQNLNDTYWKDRFYGATRPLRPLATQVYPATTVGKEFVINLSANYTTGCTWKLITSNQHIQFIKQEFEYQGKEGEYGAGGIDHWHFRALSSGTAKIVLDYSQNWDKKDKHFLTVFVPINP